MHTVKTPTLQGLTLSCRNFTRWFVRQFSSKRWAECSWFFVDRVLLWKVIFGTLRSPKLKYLEAHLFFKKYSTNRFEDHICTNKLEKCFQGLAAFFATAKPLIWLSFSFHKKLILYIFFVWKIDDFTFLILHLLILEPYKLLKEEIKSSIFIILKGLSIKKITQIVLEGQSPTFSFMTEVRNFY